MARALLVAVMIAAACCASHAAELYSAHVEGVASDAPDMLCWTYTAFNTSPASEYYLYQLQVNVDFDTYVTGATGPTGWSAYYEKQQPDHFVCWTCPAKSDQPGTDPTYYIESGESLGGFTIYFDRKPTTQEWTAGFGNALSDDERDTATGNVSTLEPGSLCGVAVGLAMFGALVRRRSRQFN